MSGSAAAATTDATHADADADADAGIALRLRLQRPGFALQADLDLPAQGITVLFGPSGSGKTTLLRCVAGLEPQARGLVRVGGDTWQSDEPPLRRPTHRRPIGYVFQEASLFEHLDVRGNLQFGLRRARAPDGPARLQEAVALLGIEGLLGRAVDTLSGGERQRVAIARALALQPRLLLLDEPLSALDAARRHEVMPWLERLRDGLRIPMLYVTHAADEATRLGDHLVLMERGQVTASGALDALLADPRTPAVEGLEPGVRLEGRVAERDARWQLARMDCDGLSLWVRDGGHAIGTTVRVRVLARDVGLATQPPAGGSSLNWLHARMVSVVPATHPSQCLVRLACGSHPLLARVAAPDWDNLALEPGQEVAVEVRAATVLG